MTALSLAIIDGFFHRSLTRGNKPISRFKPLLQLALGALLAPALPFHDAMQIDVLASNNLHRNLARAVPAASVCYLAQSTTRSTSVPSATRYSAS